MEENKKVKKPFYKRWWFWVIVVLIVIGAAGSQGGDEDKAQDDQAAASSVSQTNEDPEPQLSPQEIKEAADSNDLKIYQSLKFAKVYFENLQAKISSETAVPAEISAYCDETQQYCRNFIDHLDEVTDESAEDYKTAVFNYIGNIQLIAKDTKDFVDSADSDALSSIQEGIQLMPTYTQNVVDARTAYLKQAGFTDDEINERLADEE